MPSGSSTYPTSLDTFAPTRADADPVGPDVVKHAAALGAIESELGTNPSDTHATVKARLDATAANLKGFINHGSNAATARPAGYASVEWYGTVEPTNAINGDTWIDLV